MTKRPRITTVLKQVNAMKLKPGESVVLHGLRFTKTEDGGTIEDDKAITNRPPKDWTGRSAIVATPTVLPARFTAHKESKSDEQSE